MRRQRKNLLRLALCIDNSGYPASLEVHKLYRVLPDEDAACDGDLRVIDESGGDYLYPAGKFLIAEWPKAVEQAVLKAS
jgi:hypothetical protein